ncbi:MAG: global nitrogen regulator NtcA [Bacteroidales bacterium]
MKLAENHISCANCPIRSQLFNSLTESELAFINEFRAEVHYDRGEVLVMQGKPISEFFYLKSGLIKMHIQSKSGRERIVSIARPLDFIGLLSVFSSTHYPFSITAIEPTSACLIELEAMKKIIRRNGAFALELLELHSRSSQNVLQSTYDIDDKNLRGRIAYILLWFARRIYFSNTFELPISRKEIGELINMTTENVIRILSEYRKEGTIEIDGKTIRILNPTQLETICRWG